MTMPAPKTKAAAGGGGRDVILHRSPSQHRRRKRPRSPKKPASPSHVMHEQDTRGKSRSPGSHMRADHDELVSRMSPKIMSRVNLSESDRDASPELKRGKVEEKADALQSSKTVPQQLLTEKKPADTCEQIEKVSRHLRASPRTLSPPIMSSSDEREKSGRKPQREKGPQREKRTRRKRPAARKPRGEKKTRSEKSARKATVQRSS